MLNFQNIIVFVVVAAAGLYLARVLWRTFTGRTDCGCGTSGCGGESRHAGKRTVNLNVKTHSDQTPR